MVTFAKGVPISATYEDSFQMKSVGPEVRSYTTEELDQDRSQDFIQTLEELMNQIYNSSDSVSGQFRELKK